MLAYINCKADEIDNAEIKLNFKPISVKFINCSGSYSENCIRINYIKPYGFAAFTVEY